MSGSSLAAAESPFGATGVTYWPIQVPKGGPLQGGPASHRGCAKVVALQGDENYEDKQLPGGPRGGGRQTITRLWKFLNCPEWGHGPDYVSGLCTLQGEWRVYMPEWRPTEIPFWHSFLPEGCRAMVCWVLRQGRWGGRVPGRRVRSQEFLDALLLWAMRRNMIRG